MLEAGCGAGKFFLLLEEKGLQAMGINILPSK